VGEPLRRVAIDETRCIGCTLCIKACPVDAIVGAAKQLHTVLSTDCTGCQLCIPPCPVDCIQTEALPIVWGEELAHEARRHALARQARLNRHTAVDQPSLTSAAVEENEIDTDPGSPASNSKRATIDRVVAKARARRAQQLERLAFASAGASDTGELDTLGE
jgi:electron transport complex protein RnfB